MSSEEFNSPKQSIRSFPTTSKEDYTRGSFVWCKFNKSFWPGIILGQEDTDLVIAKNKHLIFWFGDNKASQVLKTHIFPFMPKFEQFYKGKKGNLWRKAVNICILHYGFPYTEGMNDEQLTKFALSNEMMEIDVEIHKNKLPLFIQIKLDSMKLIHTEKQQRLKNQSNNFRFSSAHYLDEIIANVCIACYQKLDDDCVEHPILDAYICLTCCFKLKDTFYCIADNSYKFCFICGNLKNFRCVKTSCEATFCNICIKNLWTSRPKTNAPYCILCSTVVQGIINIASNYKQKICAFLISSKEDLLRENPAESKLLHLLTQELKAMKVFSMFYGNSVAIELVMPMPLSFLMVNACNSLMESSTPSTGARELRNFHQYMNNSFVKIITADLRKTINISSKYMHLEDITRRNCNALSDVCLVIGGFGIPSLKTRLFRRSSFTDIFMEFWRILQLHKDATKNNVKWIFEMPHTITFSEIKYVTRYLNEEPALVELSSEKCCILWTNLDSL